MSISYISLMNTVNNLSERDQYLGRPIIMVTDEGHIITKNPLLAPFVVKGTKMWRKLGAWFWLATQNLADFPTAAQTMLNMIEWWICLNMPPAEIEEIARFKKLFTCAESPVALRQQRAGEIHRGSGAVEKARDAVSSRATQSLPRLGHDRARGKSRTLDTDAGEWLFGVGSGLPGS